MQKVLKRPPHRDIRLDKNSILHPQECGFLRRRGFPHGQMADWEIVLPDGRSIHVREYRDRYEVHWDKVSPRVSILNHLRKDSPRCWIMLSAGVAALVGSIVGGLHTAFEGFLGGTILGLITAR